MYLLKRPEDVPPRLSTRLTVRMAVLAGLVIAIVSVVLFRLWSLQVLSGDHYRALAEDNRIREVRVQPPRGRILDRNDRVLVDNRTVTTLELRPSELPGALGERRRELSLLGRVAGISPAQMRRRIREAPQFTGYPVVLRQGISRRLLFYLLENRGRFPGVRVEPTYVRRYERGSLAAHLLGNAGQVSPAQLRDPGFAGLEPGDIVGQSGLEYEYDTHLRGTPGERSIQVDALGRPKGELAEAPAEPGADLRLSLDAGVQAAGEEALRSTGHPGAFVVMDVKTGAVRAMGSYPSFDPAFYTRPHTRAEYRALEDRPDAPLLDRADQGGYPTGSAFKPITATAALEEGLIDPEEIVTDTGSLSVGGQVFQNAGGAVNGPIDMSDALQVSSDVFFYRLGLIAGASGSHGPIQDWAGRYGLGRPTGIDLPGEQPGLIPTPDWRNQVFRKGSNPYIDRPWTAGDNVNLAIGQGDLQVTPLQLAGAYAALANGGTVLTPHLGDRVMRGDRVVEEIRPAPRRHLRISDENREVILEGLHRAAMEPGGTSYPVFGSFPVAIAGKTGTAERGEGEDQSWYAAIAPYGNPRVVAVATVEQGGFGVEAAAPLVRRILERYFGIDAAGDGSSYAAEPAPGTE